MGGCSGKHTKKNSKETREQDKHQEETNKSCAEEGININTNICV